MSFNRLTYDNCAYATTVKESTSQLEYNLFKGKFENCVQCPTGNFTNILDFNSRADTESELWGITRLGSKCPSLKYDPVKGYKNPKLSPAKMCESIYYITPNNLQRPTNNMLNEKNLGLNSCPVARPAVVAPAVVAKPAVAPAVVAKPAVAPAVVVKK
jgi:hypothetical protein